jgi:dipeptidyl aminopeptidase/acylaminoacyl peptidase
VWLLPRGGGEAARLTEFKSGVDSFAWAPDSKRLVLVVSDPDPEAPRDDAKSEDKKTTKPIVTRRIQFKRDGAGYLRELRSHLHVFDIEKKTAVQISSGPYDDEQPAWSPDGRTIAFVSNRSAEPDTNRDSNIFLIAPIAGETPRAITTNPSADERPSWSPDGKTLVYVEGGAVADMWYGPNHVSTVNVATGAVKALTKSLDRNVGNPLFTSDGQAILFTIEDGGNSHLARVPSGGGAVERIVAGERDVQSFDSQGGRIALLESQPTLPSEVSVLDGSTVRRLTRTNDAFLKDIKLAAVERFKAKSKDGTMIDGFLLRPPDAKPGGAGSRPSCASMAARRRSSRPPSISSGSSSRPRVTRWWPAIPAVPPATDATSATRSSRSGANPTSTM